MFFYKFVILLLVTTTIFALDTPQNQHLVGLGLGYFYLSESSYKQEYRVGYSTLGFSVDYLFLRGEKISFGVKFAYHELLYLTVQNEEQDLSDKSQKFYLGEVGLFYFLGKNFWAMWEMDLFYTAPFYFSGQKVPNSYGLDIYSGLGVFYVKNLTQKVAIKMGFDLALNLTPIRSEFVGLNNLIALRYRSGLSFLYRIS